MKNQRNFRGGSLPVFVLVGALLAVVLLGGLYALQRYSSNLEDAGDQIAKETDEALNDDKNDDSKNQKKF